MSWTSKLWNLRNSEQVHRIVNRIKICSIEDRTKEEPCWRDSIIANKCQKYRHFNFWCLVDSVKLQRKIKGQKICTDSVRAHPRTSRSPHLHWGEGPRQFLCASMQGWESECGGVGDSLNWKDSLNGKLKIKLKCSRSCYWIFYKNNLVLLIDIDLTFKIFDNLKDVSPGFPSARPFLFFQMFDLRDLYISNTNIFQEWFWIFLNSLE